MADATETTTDAAGLSSCYYFALAVVMATMDLDFQMDAAATADAALLFGSYLSFAAAVAVVSKPPSILLHMKGLW